MGHPRDRARLHSGLICRSLNVSHNRVAQPWLQCKFSALSGCVWVLDDLDGSIEW